MPTRSCFNRLMPRKSQLYAAPRSFTLTSLVQLPYCSSKPLKSLFPLMYVAIPCYLIGKIKPASHAPGWLAGQA